MAVTRVSSSTSTCSRCERSARRLPQVFGEGGEDARPRLDQHDARLRRSRSCGTRGRSVWLAISAMAPAISTPVGPPPITTNVRSRRRALGIVLALGDLVREQHPPPDLEGIVERLEPGGEGLPLGVPEVRVRRAGRDDEVVVRDRALVEGDGPRGRIDGARLGEQHADVLLLPQDPPDRRRDVAGREARRRHLVEQRLKQVVIAAVEQRDAHRRALQGLRCREPAEASTDDHDMGCVWHTVLVLGERAGCMELVVYTSPMPQPEVLEREPRASVTTACPLDCPDSCSLSVTVRDGKIIEIDGGHENPVTRGTSAPRCDGSRARLRRRPPALSRWCAPARRNSRRSRASSGTRRSSSIASRMTSARDAVGRRIHPAVLLRRIERHAHARRPRRCCSSGGSAPRGSRAPSARRPPVRPTRRSTARCRRSPTRTTRTRG